MRNLNVGRIAAGAVIAPTVYFLLSNFQVWIGGGGYNRPKTFEGLLQCYADGLPFYKGYLLGTCSFRLCCLAYTFCSSEKYTAKKSCLTFSIPHKAGFFMYNQACKN
jgi:hypothetical protein